MTRAISQVVLVAGIVCLTAVGSLAQQTTASSETKTFEVIGVEGNVLIVRLPEGTRELTVPDDFRFTVDGKQLSVRELRTGMRGTATITTRVTTTPVTVTEVKNGTVALRSGSNIIVRTPEGVRSFTQSDVDKRGIKIYRDGKPLQLNELREGDRLTATIVTSLPPRVLTEKEVQATSAAAPAPAARAAGSASARCSACTGAEAGASAPAAGGNCGQNAAKHRDVLAAPRARERPVARDGPRLDDEAPLRTLDVLLLPQAAPVPRRRARPAPHPLPDA